MHREGNVPVAQVMCRMPYSEYPQRPDLCFRSSGMAPPVIVGLEARGSTHAGLGLHFRYAAPGHFIHYFGGIFLQMTQFALAELSRFGVE